MNLHTGTFFLLIGVVLFLGNCQSNGLNYLSSSEEDIRYYNLIKKTVIDDNNVPISVYVPKNSTTISGWDNTIVQYEWFNQKKRYVVSIDKLESSSTIKYGNDDKQYIYDMESYVRTNFSDNLQDVKSILPHFYQDVQIISFDIPVIVNDKYFGVRSLYCKDNRLINTPYKENKIVEVHFITLHKNRKYTVTFRYYGNDKGIGDLISLTNSIGGTITFE